jgi:hypothetical protein
MRYPPPISPGSITRCALLLAFAVSSLAAQTVPVDVEVGVRFLNVTGSSDMYRTQINERSGFLIRSLTIAGNDTPFTDFFRVDASDLGVGPAGSLRVDFGKSSLYRFTLAYRQTNAFSALPAFALGQHTYDRDRRMVDADLELQKWSTITPFIGFSWNKYSGPGTSTYTIGQDEFELDSNLKNRDAEVRGGFGFNYAIFSGQLTQGWRTFRDHETLTLTPGANAGNNTGPILGTQITASGIIRDDHASGHTPFTNAYVTAQATSRIKLIGSYVRFAAKSASNEAESDAGSFVSFAINRFFNGFTDQINGTSRNTTWRGGARAEIALTDKIDLFANAQREHRSLEGAALINDLFLQTVNFGGLDPRDVQTIINAHNALERDEDVFSVAASARALGPFAVRAGVSQSNQDVNVTPDLSEIVVPGPSQGGTFSRRVTSFDATGTYSKSGFSGEAWWRHDHANDQIMRTDYLNRDRYRLRAGWKSLRLTAEETTGIVKVRQLTADGDFAPSEQLRFHGALSRFRTDSSILFRHPETFAIDTSVNHESGNSVEAGVLLAFEPMSLDFSALQFNNDGTNPFKLTRYRLRASSKVVHNFGLTVELDRDRYSEPSPHLGNFTGDRAGVYVHWVR